MLSVWTDHPRKGRGIDAWTGYDVPLVEADTRYPYMYACMRDHKNMTCAAPDKFMTVYIGGSSLPLISLSGCRSSIPGRRQNPISQHLSISAQSEVLYCWHSDNIDGGSKTSVSTRILKGMSLVPSKLKSCMTCQLCLQYRSRYNHLTRLDLTTSSGSKDLCLGLKSLPVSPTSTRQIEHGQVIPFESLSLTRQT